MEDGRVAVLIPARNESASLGETLERLRRVLPQAEVTSLPGCGHFLQEDRPEEIGALLGQFFSPT